MKNNNITLLTNQEVVYMRQVGKLSALLLIHLSIFVKESISTLHINNEAEKWTSLNGAFSAPLGYSPDKHPPFPKSICTSLNDTVCHGIPNENEILKSGDILNIDITLKYQNFHSDTSKTFPIGTLLREHQNLLYVTNKCLYIGISEIKPSHPIHNIGKAISNYISKFNFSIVKNFVGHGIGKYFHMNPCIFHHKNFNPQLTFKPGMTFTIEPIINLGKETIIFSPNKWPIKTADHKYSAQFEHTLLTTFNGYEILTFI